MKKSLLNSITALLTTLSLIIIPGSIYAETNHDAEITASKPLKQVEMDHEDPAPLAGGFHEASQLYREEMALIQKNALALDQEMMSQGPTSMEKNFIYSPISTWICYELFLPGCSGKVRSDLQTKLEPFQFKDEEVKLDAIHRFVHKYRDSKRSSLSNYLFVDSDKSFNKEYLEQVKVFYPSICQMDLRQFSSETTQAINALINEDTYGLIPEYYQEDLVDIPLILMNIFAMDVLWSKPFNSDSTSKEPFTLVKGDHVNVDMMHCFMDEASYYEDEVGEYLYKSYSTGEQMLLMLPKPGETAESIRKHWSELDKDKIRFQCADVDLSLPRFSIDSRYDLVALFQSMGLDSPFDSENGNEMSGFLNGSNLFISQSSQAAKIEVNEEGTKAAAVTSIETKETTALPPMNPLVVLTFDHPFAFIIEDKGVELFHGAVYDPRN